jgi:hypothetical protein
MKAMAKSPNFLPTTEPWEKISLRLDLLRVSGPALWNRDVVIVVILHQTLFAKNIFAQNHLGTLRPTAHPPISLLRRWRARS